MSAPVEYWWDSAPELVEPQWQTVTTASRLGPFSGVTTNPMLLREAYKRHPLAGRSRSGWDLYLACGARSADYLASRRLSIPICIQLDPRSAFDAPAMLRQAAEIRDRMPNATIKVPLTRAGIDIIQALVAARVSVNATWGFTVAQLATAARTIADATDPQLEGPPSAARPRHVLTLMAGRIGELGLRPHVGHEPRLLRGAECVVFEAAYHSLRRYRTATTLLASSLRGGPGADCWHYGAMMDREVIVTLPPSFLGQQGLPALDVHYGRIDNETRERVTSNGVVRRYVAEDGYEPPEFDRLAPLVSTRDEAIHAMEDFENLASHG
ncbi:MAG TPA: transaldolase family protein [Actinophytocola sp.]|uniref:transaldolase family protein n=1 Tax=Actinophytocola sp. TaxID=1872138 RepID=UPI002DDD89D5|nr:transaldolase family protein [Actinophytocola sp.]HEV2778205.1 transaldolase family protein [Actinophytocola sp.]